MKSKLHLLIFLISFSIYSQNRNEDFFERINKETQWYSENSDNTKCIPNSLKGWFKGQFLIPNKSTENKIKIYFTENFEDNRGNHIKTYIENNTSEKVLIPRVGSTIGKIKEYYLIDSNWIQGRINSSYACGTSFGNKPLDPGYKMFFLLNNHVLTFGKIKVKYRISVNINGTETFSNTTEVKIKKDWLECLKQ